MAEDVRVRKPDGTWVSLKGPAGPTGGTGPAGSQGVQGPAGSTGPAGTAGRSVAVFDQASDPGVAALPGDFWFVP